MDDTRFHEYVAEFEALMRGLLEEPGVRFSDVIGAVMIALAQIDEERLIYPVWDEE